MRRGISLIEVIFAVSLVGLIILFLFGLLPSTGLMTRQAEQQVQATQYGKELEARLGSVAFTALKKNVGAPLTPANPGILGPALEVRHLSDGTDLHPEVQLEERPPAGRLIQAVITITWTNGEKKRTHRTVQRYSSVVR